MYFTAKFHYADSQKIAEANKASNLNSLELQYIVHYYML